MNVPPWLGKMFRFPVVRLLENAFVKLLLPWHDLILVPLCRTTPPPPKFAQKCFSPHEMHFWEKSPPHTLVEDNVSMVETLDLNCVPLKYFPLNFAPFFRAGMPF